MSENPATTPDATSGTPRFDERLSVPLWWYLPAIGLAVLLGAEVHMGYPGVRSWIGYAITVPLCIGALFWLGHIRVRVADGVLHAGEARLPLRYVGQVDVVRREDKQQALGPDLDPAANLVHRAWIGPVVRIEVTDPADDTPYWIVSTRDPDALVAALGR
ncbi:DUF3093 domain-containing protein [Pseudonocardia zijingensis]|uniref:DUF3093 domain-containing protein n=1 Tax=Pseudonocardia zijingensis TaxID=153376 RepID=A0ABP3ZMW9_9PSEU